MTCKHCGTTLHSDAERCWKCGRGLTSSLESYEKNLRELPRTPNPLAYDPDLNRAFDALAEADPLTFNAIERDLLVPLAGETAEIDELAAQRALWQPIYIKAPIRWLRRFMGEDPDPPVLSPTVKKMLRQIGIGLCIWFVVILVFRASSATNPDYWKTEGDTGGALLFLLYLLAGTIAGIIHILTTAARKRKLRRTKYRLIESDIISGRKARN